MKVIKHYQREYKKGVAIPLLRSLYDISAEIEETMKVLNEDATVDVRPMLADWVLKLNPMNIKDALKEVNYATQERLQITRGKGVEQGKGKKEKKESKK